MTYYTKSNPLPWIMAVLLLTAFIGIVVVFSRKEEPELAPLPLASSDPEPRRIVERDPVPLETGPEVEIEPTPPSRPNLSPAQAEEKLREATVEWRAFAVQLCRKQRWKEGRAVAFLAEVTWSDRDLEKQHVQGLASIRTMLGSDATDPVALAEALAGKGSLATFFEQNWSKVDAPSDATTEKKTILEDKWKPNRIRWGFALDTPIHDLQQFKPLLTAGLQAWRALVMRYVQALEIEDEAKMAKLRPALGQGILEQEAKMHAAFRVLLEMPDASVKEVVEEFRRKGEELKEKLPDTLAPKMDAAMTAAEGAK